jgi:hypothetical protein
VARLDRFGHWHADQSAGVHDIAASMVSHLNDLAGRTSPGPCHDEARGLSFAGAVPGLEGARRPRRTSSLGRA